MEAQPAVFQVGQQDPACQARSPVEDSPGRMVLMAQHDLTRAKVQLDALQREVCQRSLEHGTGAAGTMRALLVAEVAQLVVVREALRRWLVARRDGGRERCAGEP